MELIQYTASELGEPRRATIAEHIQQCQECRAAYERQIALWNTLGEWTPARPPNVLPENTRHMLPNITPRAAAIRFRILQLTRVAAAILLGVGVGHLTGRARLVETPATRAELATAAEEQAVAALGIELLARPSPAGLYEGMLDLATEAESQGGES